MPDDLKYYTLTYIIYIAFDSISFESRWGELDATLRANVCQWLEAGWGFSPGTPVSSTNKTDHCDITEILFTKCSLYYLFLKSIHKLLIFWTIYIVYLIMLLSSCSVLCIYIYYCLKHHVSDFFVYFRSFLVKYLFFVLFYM